MTSRPHVPPFYDLTIAVRRHACPSSRFVRFFPCRCIFWRHPIVSLSLRRRFERSAPFSFHSRTRELAGIASALPEEKRGGFSICSCKFWREEEPHRKRASCYEREKESEKEGEEEKKREKDLDIWPLVKIRKWFCSHRDDVESFQIGQRISGRIKEKRRHLVSSFLSYVEDVCFSRCISCNHDHEMIRASLPARVMPEINIWASRVSWLQREWRKSLE